MYMYNLHVPEIEPLFDAQGMESKLTGFRHL